MFLLEKPKERSVRNACLCYALSLVTLVIGTSSMFWIAPERAGPIAQNDILMVFCAMIVMAIIVTQLHHQAQRWLHPKVCRYRPQS